MEIEGIGKIPQVLKFLTIASFMIFWLLKLLSKNSTLLGSQKKKVNLKKKINKQWMEVLVPRKGASDEVFEVMRYPVTSFQYRGFGENISISNKSYRVASQFCQKEMKAELITPYVFESARTSLVLGRPTSPVTSEMIAPFDEDDDALYIINDSDKLDGGDDSIITFKWNTEKYFSVSNVFSSPSLTFRCMRVK